MTTSSAAAPPTSMTRTIFRVVAVAEAVSWALLLAAMFAKYVTESEPFGIPEGGVPVAGALHGGVFVAFVIASIVAWRRFGWSLLVLVVALVSAVVPFATYVFEVGADRRGLLGRPAGLTPARPRA
ncbi:DUF3817 domain-containing protein [Aeromicrobium sp. CF3.5]|uniref:DUF3817 domain-containing protein n=1 Tax=Aeromicrobium sp. CF3.5 TaxID=3373078 RepID=UPI003EE5E15D